MSRNYDNWERLVAAVVKREQIWQLCHQDSISTICSDYSSDLDSSLPTSLGSFGIADTFELIRCLRHRKFTTTDLVRLVQDQATKAVIKPLNSTGKVTEDEFMQHMTVLGNCRHENVATPWAYHSSETTKLIVYDYYSEGSVFDMLHGNMGWRPNWESRMRIAVGAARGIAHIHTQCGGKLAHGNIKSSNIFLNSQRYGCVSDLDHQLKNASQSQESDVYSFGLLLLELVTAKSAVQAPYIVSRLQASKPDAWDLSCFDLGRGTLLADEVDMEEMALDKFPFVDSDFNNSSTVKTQDLVKTLQVASKCLDELSTMTQVVLELESIPEITHKTALSNQSYQYSGFKKRVWHRFFPFGR